jgi:hypothetical protein
MVPFATRQVVGDEAGGIAAMEVLARPQAPPLCRAPHTPASVEMLSISSLKSRSHYDAYAGAFEIIHNNLTAALEA